MLPHSGFSFSYLRVSNIKMFTVCKGVEVLMTTDHQYCYITLKLKWSMFELLNGVCNRMSVAV